MIRRCSEDEFGVILDIVNDGARAYRGLIPQDCWREQYMAAEELAHEIEDGVVFWGYQQDSDLLGVMGLQQVKDVALIRHAYVRTANQGRGIGAELLAHLRQHAGRDLLVGTWAAAKWAIRFYEKHGFQLVNHDEKLRLLRCYWKIPERQAETSVVLVQRIGKLRE
jgi:N-acetylglutamate synthase-like GNAT family acetyltransferase